MRLAFLAGTLLLSAGCLSGPSGPEPSGQTITGRLDLFAHDATGLVPIPAGFDTFDVDVFHTGFFRGEPTVGVTSDGVLFATASGDLRQQVPGGEGLIARSVDGGESWQVVNDPLQNTKTDTDPWLWVDPITDRVYNIPLYIACSWLTWSDDRGDTWDSNPLGGCGLPAHDHQKLTSGPAPKGSEGGYPSVVYYAYNSFRQDGTHVSVSRDGGETFGLSVQAAPSDECHGGINGPVAVAPDGTAYLPKPVCDGPSIARSDDAGTSWKTPVVVDGVGMGSLAFIHAAVDDAGTVYVLWSGKDQRLYVSSSKDQAATWSTPVVVSLPGIRSVAFSAFDADGSGTLGLAYVGTTDDPANWPDEDPSFARPEATWHFYTAIATDADGPGMLVTTQQVTPEDDPVERGCIMGSLDEPCRNLRDFIDAHVRDGRLFAVFADGCDKCKGDQDRLPRGETVVAIQEAGPSLADGASLSPFLGNSE